MQRSCLRVTPITLLLILACPSADPSGTDSATETGSETGGDGDGVCGDGVVNATETCDDGNDDNTDACTTLCLPPACDDAIVSGDESDVDCGGSCIGCLLGQACVQASDCVSESCENSLCAVKNRVEAGYTHTCAILDGGIVRCWGAGAAGRLGYGNTYNIGDNEWPSSQGDVDVGGTVVQIGAGQEHTCALLDGGAVRCWGSGVNGQLGHGNPNIIGDDEPPSSAGDVDVGGIVVQLALGRGHTCALLDSGAVRCWGESLFGQLGYGNTNIIGDDETPASAGDVEVGGTVVQVSAGNGHTCALLDDGAVRCWGDSSHGQLGYGNLNIIGDDETPSSVGNVDVGGTVVQVAASYQHTCALLDDGNVRCWGYAVPGVLGYGNTNDIGDDETPSSAGNVTVGGTVVQLAVGRSHTCALLDGGTLRCWGTGSSGALGYGNIGLIGDNEVPVSAGNVPVGGMVLQLTAGEFHTCAMLDADAIRCWGNALYGQLGYANQTTIGDNETPASVGDVPYL